MAKSLKSADCRRIGACGMYLSGLALTLIVSSAAGAWAQQTLELPMPQIQSTQRSRSPVNPTVPTLTTPSNNVQTIPAAPPTVPALPIAQPEGELPPAPAAVPPVLPVLFRGCWRGVVSQVARMQLLPGASHVDLWMPKTYVLCYSRVGDSPFKATFTEAGVKGTRIINTSGSLKLLSTDGLSYAKMRGYFHFDEFGDSAVPLWWGSSTFAVDEVTDLHCTIGPDGMHATGVVYGERDHQPWFRAWWQTTFFHVTKLSE